MSVKSLFLVALAAVLLGGCATTPPKVDIAPPVFRVQLDTTRGPVLVEITRLDAPVGADQFYHLVKQGFFDGARFFRVVPGFVVQFGLPADPAANKSWAAGIKDDPVRRTNARGTLVFAATSEPNSRTTQLFINLADNSRLDGMGFAPIGRVIRGLDAVESIYAGDGENPDQGRIEAEGNAYLQKEFPHLDYIKSARVLR
jgi:cyclophilin family peptidyl-prolyl cis-trans isomerase